MLAFLTAVSLACAPAPPPGAEVTITSEEALVVFDGARQVQHFVRRATFDTDAAGFGFLVPTPAVPELAEADDDVFRRLGELLEPEVVVEHRRELTPISCLLAPVLLTASMEMDGAKLGGVHVVDARRVAGYDAAVLLASDAEALRGWLGDNGYDARPALTDWLQPYVDRGWTITAFKIAGDGATAATSAVRMSFSAEEPFYPYREPADQPEGIERSLRVWLVGPGRATPGAPFAGKAEYAELRTDVAALLGDAVPAGAAAGALWVTSLLDTSSPRPGSDDVSFGLDPGADPLTVPAIVETRVSPIWIPVDCLCLAVFGIGLAAGLLVLRRRRVQSVG